MTIVHNTDEVDALDAHFIAHREAELAMARGAARGEFARKIGVGTLLGGAGLGLALSGASFLVAPKSPQIVQVHDKETIVKEVPGPERIVTVTPAERKFIDDPHGFAGAEIKGRIVASIDGTALSFDTGKNWYPKDASKAADSAALIGDWGYCSPTADKTVFHCFALLRDGIVISVPQKPKGASADASPLPVAPNMVSIDVGIGGHPVKAMIDTGCGWPMAVPKVLADELLKRRLAIRAGSSLTTYADGSEHEVGVIMIGEITVEGRVLHDVEASVSPSDEAPILLGLPALNRLGSYSIVDGKLVFIGEQPA